MSRPVHWLPTEDAARTACGWAVTPRMSAVHHRHDWVTCERCHPAARTAALQAERDRRKRMEEDEAAGARYNERLTEICRLDRRVLDRAAPGKRQRVAVAGYVAEVGLERCRELLDATEPEWWPASFARRLLRLEVERESAAQGAAPPAEGEA